MMINDGVIQKVYDILTDLDYEHMTAAEILDQLQKQGVRFSLAEGVKEWEPPSQRT